MALEMRRPLPEVRAALLTWYRNHRRDLPWRRTKDPYAVWISEIMLQQTRVDTVIPYYDRFLRRWPTVCALAEADPEDIRAAWSGLGYYRRARLMRQAAQVIAEEHSGRLPADLNALRALPGFGRYTAGAVASIAFDIPAPAVDGNVARVLARLCGIDGDITRGAPQRRVWAVAEDLAQGEAPGDHTQAVIELGALVCGTKSPKCLLCPVNEACVARSEGTIDRIPPPRPKPTRKSVDLLGIVWHEAGRVLLAQQPEDGLFAGLWTPPLLDGSIEDDAILSTLAKRYGWHAPSVEPVGAFKHVLTHRDLNVRLVRATGASPDVAPPFRWVRLAEIDALGVPSLTVKALRQGLSHEDLAGLQLPGRRTSRHP